VSSGGGNRHRTTRLKSRAKPRAYQPRARRDGGTVIDDSSSSTSSEQKEKIEITAGSTRSSQSIARDWYNTGAGGPDAPTATDSTSVVLVVIAAKVNGATSPWKSAGWPRARTRTRSNKRGWWEQMAGGEKNRVVRAVSECDVVITRGSRRLLTVGVVGDGYPERRGNACATPRRAVARSLTLHATPSFHHRHPLRENFFFSLSLSLSHTHTHTHTLPLAVEVQQPCIRSDVLPSASQPRSFRSIAGISRCLRKSSLDETA